MPAYIPHLIPVADPIPADPNPAVSDPALFATYDIAIGGLGFRLANDVDKPMVWETAPYTREQIDSGEEAGEQTLSNWWMKSQSSFHGGSGQINLEQPGASSYSYGDLQRATHIRYDQSKNVDIWTPGQVARLPDTTVVTTDTAASMVGVADGATVAFAYASSVTGNLMLGKPPSGGAVQFTAVTEHVYSVCTDGQRVFAAGATGVWRVDPANTAAATKIASYAASTTPVVGWVKSRLMLGVAGAVYELDSTSGTTVAVGASQLRYQHPNTAWVWRCFASSPTSILAAGDADGRSEIVEFALSSGGATPVLTVADTAAEMPPGERVLAMAETMGTFLAIGTTSGLRVGVVGNGLTYGPLTLPASETQFAVNAVAARDRFIYGAGLAIDEPGLIRVDLGTQVDQAGRFAWSTDLIPPSKVAATPVTALCVDSGNKLNFSVPGVGIVTEGDGPGTVREAWLRTSRIRYDTTEPKLFKLCSVRGSLADASIRVDAVTSTNTVSVGTAGFVLGDPDEFNLPSGGREWLQLTFNLIGASCTLTSYGVKALPGTKRQRRIRVTCACADRESDRNNRPHIGIGTARQRALALFDLDAAGDEVAFEEFGVFGNYRTLVVIEDVTFEETGRPTNVSDFAGTLTVTMRTVS